MDVVRIAFIIIYPILYVTSVSPLTILSSQTLGLGESFTATCSADAIGVTNRSMMMRHAILERKTNSSEKNTRIAFLSAMNFGEDRIEWKHVEIRHGEEMKVQFPSQERMLSSRYDRGTLVIVAKFKALTCDDLGLYICIVSYQLSGKAESLTKSQALNLSDVGSGMYLDVYPDHSDYITRQGKYYHREPIKATCEINSQQHQKFNWAQNCGSGFKPWPDPTLLKSQQFKVAKVNGKENSCGVRHWSQVLEFEMHEECTVRCQYGNTTFSDGTNAMFTFLSMGDGNHVLRPPNQPGHNNTIGDYGDDDYDGENDKSHDPIKNTANAVPGSAGDRGVIKWFPALRLPSLWFYIVIAISLAVFCDCHPSCIL